MKKPSKETVKQLAVDLIFDFAGSLLYALGVHVFTAPNQIAPGGVIGLATVVNYLTGLPIGMISFVINIPLIFLGYKFLGRVFIGKTFKTLVISTVMLDILLKPVPVYIGDFILASLFGGVLIGAGLALVFMRGSTTGGGDIVARLVQLKMPYLPIGRAMFIVDCFVLLLSALVFQKLEAAMFGMIAIFACARVTDSMLYGLDVGKMVLVVSDKSEEIAQGIIDRLDRSATLLDAKGAYLKNRKHVVLAAVRKNEFQKLKDLIHQLDPAAFIMVAEVGEIMGNGFKALNEPKKN